MNKQYENQNKQIIHFQIPFEDNRPQLDIETLMCFLKNVEKQIPNAIVIATPFVPTIINEELGMTFENRVYTVEEIKDMIETYNNIVNFRVGK